jgi:PilZ domain
MAGDSYKYAATLVRSVEKQNERRKIPRYAVNADSEVEEPRVQAKINGRMTDLGLGGCYVDAMMTFPVDTVVHMRMMREDLKFEADARVTFSKPGLGMGLMFTGLTAAHKRYLTEWVDELSGTERIVAPATKSTPLNDEEAGVRSEQTVVQQLITLLMRKAVVTPAEYEELLRAIGKQVRNK